MVSKNLIEKYQLDEEEIELLEDEEKEITEKENEIFFEKAVKNLNKKNKLISLRVSPMVLDNIKKKAENSGINYQSLINVILKQYADGKININL